MTGPTLGEADRRAIVWDTIERMAFRPASDGDKRTWLNLFASSLAKLWDVQEVDLRIHRSRGYLDCFAIPFLALDCRCSIEDHGKYDVRLSKPSEPTQVVFWHVEVDPSFSSRRGCCKPSGEYPQQDKAKCLERDIDAVLDGMLFHPRNHAHAEELGIPPSDDPSGTLLSTHEVRLGGGVENAFVFLAHLRYQFCLVSKEVRDAERRRLRRLFYEALTENVRSVGAKDLLYPRA